MQESSSIFSLQRCSTAEGQPAPEAAHQGALSVHRPEGSSGAWPKLLQFLFSEYLLVWIERPAQSDTQRRPCRLGAGWGRAERGRGGQTHPGSAWSSGRVTKVGRRGSKTMYGLHRSFARPTGTGAAIAGTRAFEHLRLGPYSRGWSCGSARLLSFRRL